MNSRKSLFGFNTTRRTTKIQQQNRKRTVRQGLVEQLEDRRLMAIVPYSDGFYYPPIGKYTAYLPPSLSAQTYAERSNATNGSGSSPVSGSGETNTNFANLAEQEPNNTFATAQVLPLGNLTTLNSHVRVSGTMPIPTIGVFGDEDYYAFDLKAGDIFDATILTSAAASQFDLGIYDANFREVIGNRQPIVGAYPTNSPLTEGGNAGLALVIPTTGRYYARVSDGNFPYSLDLRTYRPALELQPIGTTQTIFLDFDGATIRREGFGAVGTARLSPLSNFLPALGVPAAQEPAFINQIVSEFADEFFGRNGIQATGGNGWYQATGLTGNFNINILNSLQHADPWGQPNVSRIIIGGSQLELLIPTVGIATSVDVGNFDTAETAVVLLDLIAPLWSTIPRASTVPLSAVYSKAIAGVAAHEAGHYFGGHHTLNSNLSEQIMDSGGDVTGLIGVGPDGIFGTLDDLDVQFGTDTYDPFASSISFGRQNSAAALAFGLSTGTMGARVSGNLFRDINSNRNKDAAEPGAGVITIYADANGNSVFDFGERFTISDANGNYTIGLPPGTHSLRIAVPTGLRLTSPLSGINTVTVTATSNINNINFGFEQLNFNATGVKYNDVNGNGVRDGGEAAIGNVQFYIDLDGDNRIDIGEPTARSNANGNYQLTFPGPGVYTIREIAQPGFVQTQPFNTNPFITGDDRFEYTVTVTGNAINDAPRLAGLDFGNKVSVDFGDARSSYGSASGGFSPGTTGPAGLMLGNQWDDEAADQFSLTANGDDANGKLDVNGNLIDDEDGILFPRPLVAGLSTNQVAVTTHNATGAPGYFSAWIDFNADGDFTDANEKILSDVVLGSGTRTLTFAAPSGAALGNTFARFRYSASTGVGATGRAPIGEVEDYQIAIVNSLRLAVDDVFTVRRNSVLNPLDVLANDFRIPGETLTIVTTSGSSAGGIVQSDGSKIIYTPPAGFIGQDVFTYTMSNSTGETATATVVVNVNLFFIDPQAIDDSFDVPTNAIDFPMNVLANDIEGQGGALTIIMVSQPTSGGQVTIASGGKSLRYTPQRNFQGTETFTYTAADATGKQSTARVTVQTLPFIDANTDVVFSLRTTDLNGNVISAIQQGQKFKLDVFVDDFRNDRGQALTAPGVFAAYMDLLYSLQLVSTATPSAASSSFNFDVTFDNSYSNFQRGDATIPGIIDEFGAFNSLGSNTNPGIMNFPNPVRLASITFTARSAGIAKFATNPADVTPTDDTLLFDTPGSAVPIERIRYLTTSIEIVGDSVQFPQAIDDSVPGNIPFGTINFPINVLANDLPGSTGSVTVLSATNGQNGTTRIDSQGRVLYTPNGGFNGADQFTYTIQDSRGITSTATVTLRVGAADSNDIVRLRLEVTDLNGTPIDTIAVGGQFQLRGYTEDLRGPGSNRGVFAAYSDVLYTPSVVSPIASSTNPRGFEVTFGPNYSRVNSGDINTRGILNEIGAVQTGDLPLGLGEKLLFTVNLTANAVGLASFIGDPADISPLHDTLTFQPPQPVGFNFITFGNDTINVTSSGSLGGGEFTNFENPLDVNDDGYVSPIDALGVINALNGGGSGEGEGSGRMYIDVNADGSVSPIDVLLVVNYLNSLGSGEGEGAVLQVLSSGGQSSIASQPSSVSSAVVANDSGLAVASDEDDSHAGLACPAYFSAAVASATDSAFEEEESSLDELLAELAPRLNPLS